MTTVTGTAGPYALSGADREALARRVEEAARRARARGHRVIASLTVPVEPSIDPTAAIARARRPDDRWVCLEQPDRDGFALAGVGEAAVIEASGSARFAEAARLTRSLADGALVGARGADPGAPAASGPVWVGGFAFAPDGGAAHHWRSLAPAQLTLPELSLARHGSQARLTVNALVDGDDDIEEIVERLAHRAASLEDGPLPLLDPDPARPPRVDAATPPSHYEAAVARAVERIGAGGLDKVVLAREVRVHAEAGFDVPAVFGAIRASFPECYCYCVGTPELAFVGASPELLVRREGARAQTVALAGTTRRSADPSVDTHLGEQLLASAKDRKEQAIVARRIERTLGPLSVWVAPAEEPVLVKVQNVQHLATPIRAQLADSVPTVELVGRLHPTPAVGGEPWSEAEPLIPALEGLDRGWYAGPVGWTDLAEDGEFCVALRCALVRDKTAHLYAGDGIVAESVPAEELAETEAKLGALLPLLS